MASNELIIDDDYCKAMGVYFEKQGEKIDKLVSEYISILRQIRSQAIKDGEVASALSSYIRCVEQLNNQVGFISNTVKNQVNRFVEEIDSEDQASF